ncbi:MAG: hypothetical protein R6W66_10070 [Pelovirga sp.]
MMSKLRVSETRAYRLYREVEPLQPYPRIDAQQPREEQTPAKKEVQTAPVPHARRRFGAMRKLIAGLKESGRILHVDYQTLTRELHQIATAISSRELIALLQQHRVSAAGRNHLKRQLRQRSGPDDVVIGPALVESNNVFPLFVSGLRECQLRYDKLELLPGQEGPQLLDAIAREGHFRCATQSLQLLFRPLVKVQYDTALELDVNFIIGVGEVDDAGRRAILYQRTATNYGLYTDKQINLTI